MHALIFTNLVLFLSTLSLRRATDGLIASANFCKFLSTLSLRRATGILGRRLWYRQQFLSTLSLRRATTNTSKKERMLTDISIHALLAESDSGIIWRDFVGRRFLSTLSLRRATSRPTLGKAARPDFYPRSPCGERLYTAICKHLLFQFLSTLSLRRATLLMLFMVIS